MALVVVSDGNVTERIDVPEVLEEIEWKGRRWARKGDYRASRAGVIGPDGLLPNLPEDLPHYVPAETA